MYSVFSDGIVYKGSYVFREPLQAPKSVRFLPASRVAVFDSLLFRDGQRILPQRLNQKNDPFYDTVVSFVDEIDKNNLIIYSESMGPYCLNLNTLILSEISINNRRSFTRAYMNGLLLVGNDDGTTLFRLESNAFVPIWNVPTVPNAIECLFDSGKKAIIRNCQNDYLICDIENAPRTVGRMETSGVVAVSQDGSRIVGSAEQGSLTCFSITEGALKTFPPSDLAWFNGNCLCLRVTDEENDRVMIIEMDYEFRDRSRRITYGDKKLLALVGKKTK
jgi:hypothetical protein